MTNDIDPVERNAREQMSPGERPSLDVEFRMKTSGRAWKPSPMTRTMNQERSPLPPVFTRLRTAPSWCPLHCDKATCERLG